MVGGSYNYPLIQAVKAHYAVSTHGAQLVLLHLSSSFGPLLHLLYPIVAVVITVALSSSLAVWRLSIIRIIVGVIVRVIIVLTIVFVALKL